MTWMTPMAARVPPVTMPNVLPMSLVERFVIVEPPVPACPSV